MKLEHIILHLLLVKFKKKDGTMYFEKSVVQVLELESADQLLHLEPFLLLIPTD